MSRKDTEQSTNHGKLVNQPHEVIQWWYIMVPRLQETTFFSAIWATYWEFGGSSRPSMEILKRHNMWSIHTMGNQLGNNMWNMQSAKMFCWFLPSQRFFLGSWGFPWIVIIKCELKPPSAPADCTPVVPAQRRSAWHESSVGCWTKARADWVPGGRFFFIGDFSMGDKDRYCMIQGIRLLPTISRGIAILGDSIFQDFMRVW